VAKTYGSRPSAIAGIRDGWLAYQFDAAVAVYGELPASGGAGALSASHHKGPVAFRDAHPYVTRRMPIPEEGVW